MQAKTSPLSVLPAPDGTAAAPPLVSTTPKSHPVALGGWIDPLTGEVLGAAWLESSRCPAPKRGLALRLPSGLLIPCPCTRVSCAACGKFHALTALEMVRDTAARMGRPQVALTLTSVDPARAEAGVFSKDVEQVMRALRRRWPGIEYLGFMEWTTGRAARSGGIRRPHMHLLVRGLPPEDAAEAEAITRRVWLRRTGASVIECVPLRCADDGSAYLALHHLKPAQHAPEGWKGRRLRPSKGWWGTDAAALKKSAQNYVRDRAHRERIKAGRRAECAGLSEAGLPPDVAAELVYGPDEDPVPIPPREGDAVLVVLPRRPVRPA